MSTGAVSARLCSHYVSADICSCMAGFRMFPRDRAQTVQIATASPPVGEGRGTGVFATFNKIRGILHVIILCLNPEHFVSVFSWNMLSSFQLNVQVFFKSWRVPYI